MLDDLIDRAWSCFNKMDKKPPDRSTNSSMIVAETLRRRSSIGGPMILDPSFLPDKHKLDSEFKQLLQELDLNPVKEQELRDQSAEKKWVMIMEHQSRQDKSRLAAATPTTAIQRLQEWSRFFPDKYARPLAVQQLEALGVSLRTENISYVQKFIELDGITLLTRILAETRNGADCIALPILTCFKALLNSSSAQKFVLERSDTLLSVVGAIDSQNSRCQLLALEILGGLCLVPERGHYAVLKSLTDATTILGERTRFQKLVDELHKEHGSARETERVRTALISLLNALLKAGPAEQSLEFRLHLRYELLMLGMSEVIEGVRGEHGQDMENHLDFFEMQRKDDEEELLSCASSSSGIASPPNIESAVGLVEVLNRKLDKSVAQKHLLSILQHMLLLSIDENHLHLWKLYDLILQQLSLQLRMQNVKNVGEEVDAALAGQSLGVDIDRIMAKLRSEEECQRLEKECMEKDKKILELENRLSDLQDGFSLSSFSRSSDLGSSSPSEPCHSPTPSSSSSLPPVIKAPIPPPPPPPMASQLRLLGGPILNPTAPKKKVPKPMGQVKSVNWSTIPHTKTNGTIWENIGDEKLYDKLNLQQLCTTFASTKDPADPGTLHRRIVKTETVASVIEFRRAQNCNIMLSRLKMSHRDIRTTVLSMDEKGRLPRDMIEQMLKFIPTKDELAALDETLAKCSSPAALPLADRYLFEVGQIPRYEQRLRCLHIIRSFQERVDSLKPFMNSVIKASGTLSSSNRLKQLLALLLAIGNYLNFGKRNGNAMGFTIRSLNTVQDVKSALKADRTLLHYTVELIEQQFPDLMKLKKELNFLYDATKFTRAETEQEMQDIQTALRYVSNQYNEHLQQQKQKSAGDQTEEVGNDSGVEIGVSLASDPKAQNKKTDKFLPTVKAFLNTANKQMNDLEQLNEEMKTKFVKCAAYFCEDATNSSPDEFFRVFAKFLSQFADCHATVLKEREDIEREKRQTISRTMLQKKCGKKQRDSGAQLFDVLVNELTKGELFREDLSRLSQKYPWKKKQVTSVQINA